eukprot:GFUD01033538.1.p1 GENE.GFUD01033538.1~~GFUD01033538.1.p1  ORF type:complete len:149 (+),score=19.10 GFUD01033538.1:35-448(+)
MFTFSRPCLLLFVFWTFQGEALVCQHCEFNQCGPLGGIKEVNCGPGQWFCEVDFVNGKAVTKGCADKDVTKIPAGYIPVDGNKLKRCKEQQNGSLKHCYCKKNRCNAKEKAFTSSKSDVHGSCMLLSVLTLIFISMI